ncbi:hypothetical protein [Paenarthrobacter sp. AB444]|uniref:hypothetical protein n=1 Tax=Paenarthrobacter sp. AB444 TaxID=3025681 RepID=UPI002365C381|nr:hypothetical protein [Paenarthrobacter sp. AB444]MDD7835649.1 hypothetical protein [Paenarthrobacter sp. AB444]
MDHYVGDEAYERSAFVKERESLVALAFSVVTALLLVVCGVGPGLGRYLPVIKPVLNLIPDICVVLLVILAIFVPRYNTRFTNAGRVAWLFILLCLLVAIPSIATLAVQGVYGLRSMLWGLVIALLLQTSPLPIRSRTRIRRVLIGVLVTNMLVALFQAVVGLNAVELQSLVEAGSSFQVGSQTRLLGLQATGQELSMVAGSAFVWVCAVVVVRGFKQVGLFMLILGGTSAVVTLVVLQRSALIGALAAIAILVLGIGTQAVNSGGRAVRRIASIAGGCIFAVVGLALVAPDRVDLALARFQSLFGLSTDYSFSVRQEITLPVALRLIGEQPLGYGLGASGPVASSFAPAGPLAAYPLGGLAADNGYLFVALQVGLPGLAVFVLLLALWVWDGGFVVLPPQDRMPPRAVVSFLAAIMLSGSFWGLTGSMAVIAVLASLGSWKPPEGGPPSFSVSSPSRRTEFV